MELDKVGFFLFLLSRSLAPMSKEDYDRKRNTIRRVVDPETGRTRLIRGEGEVLEEIVSRDRHKEINKVCACSGAGIQGSSRSYTQNEVHKDMYILYLESPTNLNIMIMLLCSSVTVITSQAC